MADVPILVCTSGELAGQRFDVPEGGLDIGRADENGVVVRDDGVSRFHARLLYDNGQLWLQDAGSRNGVFVNGQRVTGHRALKVGDEITIAKHVFSVKWRSEGTAEEPAAPEPARSPTPTPKPAGRWWWPFS